MQAESVVSQWLGGADADGLENPAGPLFIYGEAMTRSAASDSSIYAGSSSELTCVSPAKCC